MLAGGGTAGHVYPLLAIHAALKHRMPVLNSYWVGSERIESQLVPDAGVSFHQIDIRFSYRAPVPANWGYYLRHILPLLLGRPFRQALQAVDGFRPQVVLASGGYVASPVIWAAIKRGIPVALVEINNPPGRVNWHFAPEVWRVYCATHGIADQLQGRCCRAKVQVLGYPVRTAERTRAKVCTDYNISLQRRILLVMGGSLGAGTLHRAVRELLLNAQSTFGPPWRDLTILHVAGERSELLTRLMSGFDPYGSSIEYRPVGYLKDSVGAMMASDFYLGRSGAATVGELLQAGIPALLVPDPQHTDLQQYGNAQVLVDRGQGSLLEQDQLNAATLTSWLKGVWDKPRISPDQPAPAEDIADDLLSVWEDAGE
jgi:UDP-N-acetylglucosamine--N-acetylmuramyl-(pentapeptide) pyrophosphoryl-undecaprenol N-acetylglucosamine transferase